MKITKIIAALAISMVIATSCTKELETENLSRTTFFADLTMAGAPVVFQPIGEAFNDPGVTATENGDEIPVVVSGSVDVNTPGFYNISYSAVNSDGFASSLSRTVIVYENGDVVGIYDGTRVGVSGGLILLSTNPGGGYFISDLLGGYYEFGRSYGNDYAAPSTIQISGNTVTAGVGNCAFGPVELTNGEISDDHQTMTWRATLVDYAFGFDVELTKITN
ncbi:MAG: DUF5012 domain-containing protein [Saprospiraceae bacterium]|nr:DUF5012 domain-containing protein [Saprospiraceae bacterium]MCB9323576.1 DUF5012 domain-containing protein [Lewinellaceae bacterium]